MDSVTAGEYIASELVVDDPEFEELVQEFVESLGQRVEAMTTALAEEDFETFRKLAHQLKGAGGGFGYPIITEKAAILEANAKDLAQELCVQAFDDFKNTASRIVVKN